jgi:hypothetical protein
MQPSDITILLARQRSGTNPLRSVLGTHPAIACTEEIFNNRPPPHYWLGLETNYFRFIDKRLGGSLLELLSEDDASNVFLDYLEYVSCFYEKPLLLLDVKYNSTHHLNGPWHFITEEPALFEFIKENRMRVLNLTRMNFLRYYLSEMKAQSTRTWGVFDEAVVGDREWYVSRSEEAGSSKTAYEDSSIELDIGDMLERLTLCRAENQYVHEAFRDYDRYLTFDYEELFPERDSPPSPEALTRISSWLEVDDEFSEKRPEYRKQSHLGLADSIKNFDEVADALRGTDLEYCLKDESMYRSAARSE